MLYMTFVISHIQYSYRTCFIHMLYTMIYLFYESQSKFWHVVKHVIYPAGQLFMLYSQCCKMYVYNKSNLPDDHLLEAWAGASNSVSTPSQCPLVSTGINLKLPSTCMIQVGYLCKLTKFTFSTTDSFTYSSDSSKMSFFCLWLRSHYSDKLQLEVSEAEALGPAVVSVNLSP